MIHVEISSNLDGRPASRHASAGIIPGPRSTKYASVAFVTLKYPAEVLSELAYLCCHLKRGTMVCVNCSWYDAETWFYVVTGRERMPKCT